MGVVETAADKLWNAMTNKQVIEPVRELIGDNDVSSAYAVQRIINKNREAQGHKRIGYKIGLTSEAVQRQLGVDQPDYGILFDQMLIEDGGVLQYSDLIQPKVEAEIAFILGKDITGKITEDSFLDSVLHVCSAIEIVGSRVRDWDIKITDTIADNAAASHFVLSNSKFNIEELDLINCQMQLKVNDELVSTGQGSSCMGSPVKAAVWLAKTMQDLKEPLHKGDIILSGALGPMVVLSNHDQVEANIEGLGAVSFKVS